MRTNHSLIVLFAALSLFSCVKKEESTGGANNLILLPDAPEETERIIKAAFPGAIRGSKFADSLFHYLAATHDIKLDKILLGVSTCVDDIIYTKNFHLHPEIKGPFHLGGLAGLPFTGISGLQAFAHHVPDSGAMVLLVEPHIGYSQKKGWGYVLRPEQQDASSCCGALMGTLGKLTSGTLRSEITEDDYQGGKIAEFALAHKQEILTAENPILELTRITSDIAEEQIRAHVLDVGIEHVKYIIIVTGVLINTDYTFTDYQYTERISVYDVRKKKFL